MSAKYLQILESEIHLSLLPRRPCLGALAHHIFKKHVYIYTHIYITIIVTIIIIVKKIPIIINNNNNMLHSLATFCTLVDEQNLVGLETGLHRIVLTKQTLVPTCDRWLVYVSLTIYFHGAEVCGWN